MSCVQLILISCSVCSTRISASGVFVLESTIGLMNISHRLSDVMYVHLDSKNVLMFPELICWHLFMSVLVFLSVLTYDRVFTLRLDYEYVSFVLHLLLFLLYIENFVLRSYVLSYVFGVGGDAVYRHAYESNNTIKRWLILHFILAVKRLCPYYDFW